MSHVTELTLDTVKAHIEAIEDGFVFINVVDGKITLIDSIHKNALIPKKVNVE